MTNKFSAPARRQLLLPTAPARALRYTLAHDYHNRLHDGLRDR
jgi:hypothetical protein